MIRKLFPLLAWILAAVPGMARTWTSADGSKTFEGEFGSYDAAAGKVSVKMANGKTLTFTEDKLSEADRQWLKEQATAAASGGSDSGAAPSGDIATQIAAQKIGSKLSKCLVKFGGSSFKRFQLEKVPEYYIAYFSASW